MTHVMQVAVLSFAFIAVCVMPVLARIEGPVRHWWAVVKRRREVDRCLP